ncbi:CaiB/BaiF CoA-transferase family protein [Frankia sp. Cppng1_Ct_nod]|uniref:CaiB/BaiF CoA transferase family protein n=1 Tax=Frankia sp. Cppng1_Ct_nod TaxID=2897162 RepID=UPI0013EFAECD|nr:CaiB/BaiF CoA-transferase family protein [Frankia sp. Cppng1_Ct_nod]
MPYSPLAGVRVLDLGILIPSALVGHRLAALGAEVVKIEQRGRGDRVRMIPPFTEGESQQFRSHLWGRRSIELDLRDADDQDTFRRLAEVADVVVENQLAGTWARLGLDLGELRAQRPELVVCSLTGFGQTGPLAALPSHGLNMDALADGLSVQWRDGQQRLAPTHTSWGNELGSLHASLAIVSAVLAAKMTGEGAWIDVSCWDALVESHRAEIATQWRTGEPCNAHERPMGPLYDIYRAGDGRPVLFGALEPKFFERFCAEVGRPDLVFHHGGGEIEFGFGNETLRRELEGVFAQATAEEWQRRFTEWDVPGSPVLQLPDVIRLEHFSARGMLEGAEGTWPNVLLPIRWHHADERAGTGLTPPPDLGADTDDVLREWLGP